MSVNKYLDHLLVLPEDDANRNILNRFVQHDEIQKRSIQILPPAGGWLNVLEEFEQDHAKYMKTYPKRRVLLVLDFDEDSARLQAVRDRIPADVRDRVFVLGSWSDPEKLRNALGRSLEEIGASLAEDCFHHATATWDHALLRHNVDELARSREQVRPFLFDDPK